MTGTRIIVATEDELRRLIREELEAQRVEVTVKPVAEFTPIGGGPTRRLKSPPQAAGRQPDGMGGFTPAAPTPSSAPQGGD